MLTKRQELILKRVVEGYVELGVPVGSKWIAAGPGMRWGASTVRAELAELERGGLLEHPHTSAGRVPTDVAYRHYADRLLGEDLLPSKRQLSLDLTAVRREVDTAMEQVAHMLAQVTELMAIVSAPSLRTAQVRHVEILPLQPNVVAMVVITSTGGVTRRVFTFSKPVDQGLVDWAGSYFNERLRDMELGARRLGSMMDDSELSPSERDFVDTLGQAFTELDDASQSSLYIEGVSYLLDSERIQNAVEINSLMRVLEERYSLLALLKSAISERGPYLRIGRENEAPELQSLSIVAANYGLGHRNLGAVSVIGPTRMDYATAIGSVREAATTLSRFVEDVYQ